MKVSVAGEDLELLPGRAIYWAARKILIFSDVHFGKPESFQAMGIPIPSGAHLEDISRIEKLLELTSPDEVFILGDLIHNKKSWSEDIQKSLNDFFCQHAEVRWHLLLGNHEKGSKPFLDKLPINLIEGDFPAEPFLFSHGHDSGYRKESQFVIQGHIHPVIRLHHGAIRLRLRCFVLDRDRLTMPSFGSLTGGFEISRARGRRIFATTLDTVFEIPNSETNRRGVDK